MPPWDRLKAFLSNAWKWLVAAGAISALVAVIVDKKWDDSRRLHAAEIEISKNVDQLRARKYGIPSCQSGDTKKMALVHLSNTAISAVLSSGSAGDGDLERYVDINIAIIMRNKFVDELFGFIGGQRDISSSRICVYVDELMTAIERCDGVIDRGRQ